MRTNHNLTDLFMKHLFPLFTRPQKVDLTKASEGDLNLLKSRSENLKNEVNQLTGVKKQLAELGSKCDSTKLVKKPE